MPPDTAKVPSPELLCQHRPIFPGSLPPSIVGSAELNFCVRNGNRWTLCDKMTNFHTRTRRVFTPDFCLRIQQKFRRRNFCVSIDLSSRAVSRQVLSAPQSLTSVFGMGTGGPSAIKTLTTSSVTHFRRPHHREMGNRVPRSSVEYECGLGHWCTFRDSNPGPTD